MKKIFNFLKEIVLWMVSIYAILVVLSILILLTEDAGVEKPFNGVTHSSHKITTYEWEFYGEGMKKASTLMKNG